MNPSMPHLMDYSHLGVPTRRCRTSWARCCATKSRWCATCAAGPAVRFPQFDREPLEARLTAAKIRYEFCGEQLGGRPLDPQFYLAKRIRRSSKRRRAPAFLEAIDKAIASARERKEVREILCAGREYAALPSASDVDLPGAGGPWNRAGAPAAGRSGGNAARR